MLSASLGLIEMTCSKIFTCQLLHLQSSPELSNVSFHNIQPTQSTHHQTYDGSSRLQAIGHTNLDVFSVGSMGVPRRVEIFDASQAVVAGSHAIQSLSGDAVTSVYTHMTFHPREDRLLLAVVDEWLFSCSYPAAAVVMVVHCVSKITAQFSSRNPVPSRPSKTEIPRQIEIFKTSPTAK
jgi:hypothetical protein